MFLLLFSQIYAPNDKKSFMTVTGEWSGLMESKLNNVTDGSKQVRSLLMEVLLYHISIYSLKAFSEAWSFCGRKQYPNI